jgi:hypothetical protein
MNSNKKHFLEAEQADKKKPTDPKLSWWGF